MRLRRAIERGRARSIRALRQRRRSSRHRRRTVLRQRGFFRRRLQISIHGAAIVDASQHHVLEGGDLGERQPLLADGPAGFFALRFSLQLRLVLLRMLVAGRAHRGRVEEAAATALMAAAPMYGMVLNVGVLAPTTAAVSHRVKVPAPAEPKFANFLGPTRNEVERFAWAAQFSGEQKASISFVNLWGTK